MFVVVVVVIIIINGVRGDSVVKVGGAVGAGGTGEEGEAVGGGEEVGDVFFKVFEEEEGH